MKVSRPRPTLQRRSRDQVRTPAQGACKPGLVLCLVLPGLQGPEENHQRAHPGSRSGCRVARHRRPSAARRGQWPRAHSTLARERSAAGAQGGLLLQARTRAGEGPSARLTARLTRADQRVLPAEGGRAQGPTAVADRQAQDCPAHVGRQAEQELVVVHRAVRGLQALRARPQQAADFHRDQRRGLPQDPQEVGQALAVDDQGALPRSSGPSQALSLR